jgi:chromate transporter
VNVRHHHLLEVAQVGAKLGVIGFGGPASHVALLRVEVVERRGWISDAEFLDLLGVTSALPGPGSTQMVMAVGRRRAGVPGMIAGGVCFITPAAAMVLLLAWLYVRYGRESAVGGVLYGIKPVVCAVVVAAIFGLGAGVARAGRLPLVVAVLGAGAYLGGVNPLVVLAVGAAVVCLWDNRARLGAGGRGAHIVIGVVLGAPAASRAATPGPRTMHAGLWAIALEFAKLGVVVFGSGYVLLAFLQHDLVDHLHWVTSKQLLDAVAAGQVTPGPVFTTATFVGYLTAGAPGALVATTAIFLPSFLMVAAIVPVLPRVRTSPWASGALDGVSAAAVGLMAGVAVQLARAGIVDALTAVVAVATLVALVRFKVNTAWLVLVGGAIGVLHSL